MPKKITRTALSLLTAGLFFFSSVSSVFASTLDTSVVDLNAPFNRVTLIPGDSAEITIDITVKKRQTGTATFQIYTEWTLNNGVFTGSAPKSFTVDPQSPGTTTTFSEKGKVTVASGQGFGTFDLTVEAFDITNTSSADPLEMGKAATYSVIVPNNLPSDTTPPVITTPADMTVEATGPDGAFVDFTVSALDAVDGAVSVTAMPASGSKFPLGSTTVSLTASDSKGNTATDSFLITVVDTTAPDITVPDDITAEATGPSGAVVTFSPTAWDIVDEAVDVIAVPTSGSTFPLGTTTVDLSATDASGNKAAAAFTVTVVDTTPPKLTVPDNITVNAVSSAGALVNFDPATAIDLVDQDVEITYTQNSGTWFPLGTTTVVVTAKDDYGNTATGSFTVTVKYDFKGFFQPVDMSKVNIAKAGSAIPIKFSLGGDMGLNIMAEGYPKVMTFIVDTDADTDIIETTVTAGASKLTYDPIADQYIYVWKTEKSWSGTGKKLIVVLQDGTSHEAKFQFRK